MRSFTHCPGQNANFLPIIALPSPASGWTMLVGLWCSWDRTGATPMLGKLKDLFGPKKKANTPAKPAKVVPVKMKRVNIKRRFTLISLTGQGSMSVVHKAVDNDNGRSVCLKVQHFAKQAAANARTSVEQRPPEGEIASKIVHPHVVRTFEFGMTPKGDHFIVMEFIE